MPNLKNFKKTETKTVEVKKYDPEDDKVAFTFAVSKGQAKKYEEWRAKRNPYAYSGTIGGRETWEFSPTSIGLVVKVRDCMGNMEDNVLDLSDYENW